MNFFSNLVKSLKMLRTHFVFTQIITINVQLKKFSGECSKLTSQDLIWQSSQLWKKISDSVHFCHSAAVLMPRQISSSWRSCWRMQKTGSTQRKGFSADWGRWSKKRRRAPLWLSCCSVANRDTGECLNLKLELKKRVHATCFAHVSAAAACARRTAPTAPSWQWTSSKPLWISSTGCPASSAKPDKSKQVPNIWDFCQQDNFEVSNIAVTLFSHHPLPLFVF